MKSFSFPLCYARKKYSHLSAAASWQSNDNDTRLSKKHSNGNRNNSNINNNNDDNNHFCYDCKLGEGIVNHI